MPSGADRGDTWVSVGSAPLVGRVAWGLVLLLLLRAGMRSIGAKEDQEFVHEVGVERVDISGGQMEAIEQHNVEIPIARLDVLAL